MANFLSILKKIGSFGLAAEHLVEPAVEAFYPPSAPLFAIFDKLTATAIGSVNAQEIANPAPGAGASKLAAVTRDIEVTLGIADDTIGPLLAAEGKQITYDKALKDKAVSELVAALNDFAAVKASLKIGPLVKSA